MTTTSATPSTTTALEEARALAKTHRLRIATVKERRDPAVPGDYVDEYQLYGRTGLIGQRRDPADLLSLVKRFTKAR